MEFTVEKANLLRELQLVQGVVERKTTIPILAHVLLKARREGLEVIATDMELGVQSLCEAQVSTGGEAAIHARKLHDIVRALPEAEVHFTLEEAQRVRIRCANAEFRIASQGTEDFPSLREYDFKGAVTVPLEMFRSMIQRVEFAITEEDPRYAIRGALLIIRKGGLELVATDGHRLACVKRQADISPREEIRIVVPKKMLSELAKVEGGPEGELRLGLKENHIFAKSGLRMMQSSLIEGPFPNYEKVIPTANDRKVRCQTEAILSALRRVSLLSSERTRLVKLSLEAEKMTISTSNADFGEAKETIETDGFAGGELEIGFNSRYLIEFLQVVGTSHVQLEVKNSETQGLVRPVDADGVEYTYVVMPVRL